MMTRPGFVILTLLSTLAALVAVNARAQNDPARPPPAPAWAMQAPGSADVVVEVRDAAKLRGTPIGRALNDLISRAGLLGDTRRSWDELAKTLGWQREQAFDQLLGDRFMIVITGSIAKPGSGPARWAVLSRVSEATDRLLIEKLAAAPRQNAAGHQLLSVERGTYELAIHRPPPGQPGDRVVVLGPRERPELFDQVLRQLNDSPAPGESGIFLTSAATTLKELGDADALILVRRELENPRDAKAAADPWAAHTAVAVRADDTGISLRCTLCDPTAADLLNSEAGGPAIDLDAAFTGALIATSEHQFATAAFEPDSPLTEILAKVRLTEPLERALRPGQMFVVMPSPAPPGLAAGLALRVKDPMGVAREADAFMAGLVRHIEGEPRRDGGVQALDFAGVAPLAVRAIPVDAWGAFARLDWPELWLSWSYAISPARSGLEQRDPPRGWWVIGAAAGKSEEAGAGRALANDLVAQLHAAAPPDEHGRVLSQGVIRPAALAKAVWPGVPDLGSWREVFGRISLVRWRLDASDGGRMEGVVRVELTPAPTTPAGGTPR